jgi:hypothetical protein
VPLVLTSVHLLDSPLERQSSVEGYCVASPHSCLGCLSSSHQPPGRDEQQDKQIMGS